ncbi:cytidine/deoxycytidylate deaminase family protein [Myxococcota bacterium]|nr:cytidine/deoxycytidylate deaminase family protein [Myxococcota bacterium]MBU1379774.1 cytidine/deoxycytidylate deaminase family protein [Myxococcota bacterium]MBU1498514.1 cytidine/deoxycytidylate deaminase family protein [Myxococcota bacterium]
MDTNSRLSWDEYFMSIASVVSQRSTCPRKFVGAVIVKNNTILSTGYNGSLRGAPHCQDVGCMMENGHCVATIHAEANAIIHAARHGVATDGASIYVTASPCWNCFKMIVNAGISRICYGEFYRDERTLEWAGKLGVDLVHVPPLDPSGT